MKTSALLVAVIASLTGLLCAEEAKKPAPPKAWVDPANVDDEDYKIQGEYVFVGDGHKLAAQIWAKGGGKFEAVGYKGGLPGAGWDQDRSSLSRTEGTRETGQKVASFRSNEHTATVDGETIKIAKDGEVAITLTKVNRQSPTLGAKAPAGAVVLFDGKDVSHFPGAKMTAEGLLEQGATSSDKFGDGTLHVEFMLSYMPTARGQGRSNSGVYLQGRYEVQVLDSFALEGKNNECGGIYSIHTPKLNMCLPPLTWQTYDIDFTAAKYDNDGKKTSNARMTVKHNGVVIHENVDIPHITTAAPVKEENTPGPLYLQNHNNPVRYRNIWFLPK